MHDVSSWECGSTISSSASDALDWSTSYCQFENNYVWVGSSQNNSTTHEKKFFFHSDTAQQIYHNKLDVPENNYGTLCLFSFKTIVSCIHKHIMLTFQYCCRYLLYIGFDILGIVWLHTTLHAQNLSASCIGSLFPGSFHADEISIKNWSQPESQTGTARCSNYRYSLPVSI